MWIPRDRRLILVPEPITLFSVVRKTSADAWLPPAGGLPRSTVNGPPSSEKEEEEKPEQK